ncbi:MAG: T9SS type A sorting domain-containing protein [Saprospiraceae bacterium]|nr:T9SS type A sorting domain-containing protein [Saprospiraceae bacterium]
MNKILPLIFSLLLLPAMLLTQEYIRSQPSVVTEVFSVDLSDEADVLETEALLINDSPDTLELHWVKEVLEEPEGWETQYCDNEYCYGPGMDSSIDPYLGMFQSIVLWPGDTLNMALRLYPNGTYGKATYELLFSRVATPEETLQTIIFELEVVAETQPEMVQPDLSIRLYPNPVMDYLVVEYPEEVEEIVIYNLIGQPVRFFKTFEWGDLGRSRIDLSDLPNGLYLLSAIDKQSGIIQTLRFSKRSFDP